MRLWPLLSVIDAVPLPSGSPSPGTSAAPVNAVVNGRPPLLASPSLSALTGPASTIAIVATIAIVLAGPVSADKLGDASNGGRPFTTALTGAAEVPGPGDPDGSGTASITLNSGQSLICYSLEVSGIAPATAAHIHLGTADVAGPVVIGLIPPTSGSSSGCADASQELIKAIQQNPSNYYVNVHNIEYPAGALRGQLGK